MAGDILDGRQQLMLTDGKIASANTLHVAVTMKVGVALEDRAFELSRGKVHALPGSSGCGKSTLRKVMAGGAGSGGAAGRKTQDLSRAA